MIKRKQLAISIAAALSLQACATLAIAGGNRHVLPVKNIEFTATPAPVGDAEQTTAYTKSSVVVTLPNGKKKVFPLGYNVLYSSGDQIGNWKAGTVVDKSGAPLMALKDDAANDLAYGPFYARSPDANSLLRNGNAIKLVTHFEYDTEVPSASDPTMAVSLYGQLPMVMRPGQHRTR